MVSTHAAPSSIFRFRSAREAEAFLLGFVNYEQETRYRRTTSTHDVAGFRRRLEGMGWDSARIPTVHVAGTNGKGTVACLLERVLRAGGLHTGLYTSPHLENMRERIRMDGRPLSAARFQRDVARLARVFHREPEGSFRTTFEYLTALALLAFQGDNVDRAVVEVGLGGRLDATNVLAPGPAVITPISLDHRDVLGNTVRAIAADKAGILKPGGTAYLMSQPPSAQRVVRRRIERLGIPAVEVRRRVAVSPLHLHEAGSTWHLRGREDYGEVRTRLLGLHQGENLSAVVTVAEDLLPPEACRRAVRRGLSQALVAGRLEARREGGRWWVLDGGHNPAAGRALALALLAHYPGQRVVAVVGMARDKDHRGFLRALAPRVSRFVLTAARSPRAASPDDLARACPGRCRKAADVEEALAVARELPAAVVLVTGSFLVAGEARRLLRG